MTGRHPHRLAYLRLCAIIAPGLTMAWNDSDRPLKLRPHHICCLPFLTLDGDNLDRSFFDTLISVQEALKSELGLYIETVEGPDYVCQACPSCIRGRCESPPIQEEKVRKLDRFLLRDLGMAYGQILTVEEWQSVISRKWPYRLCRICRWRHHCGAAPA